MKIITALSVMFLIVGCASSPRTYDSKQTQLNLTHISECDPRSGGSCNGSNNTGSDAAKAAAVVGVVVLKVVWCAIQISAALDSGGGRVNC